MPWLVVIASFVSAVVVVIKAPITAKDALLCKNDINAINRAYGAALQ
uniref:Uncharacterized protein n=1 Tax=Physcomitrium patens TaxID=3218 RepID=A0A2K1ID56_PHYPA|nr:hypothetical protein PHYPA_030691 [Physcomitrium patens]